MQPILLLKKEKGFAYGWKDFRFTITGSRPFTEAIITSGGVDVKEI